MIKKYSKGFTLIELLLVIVIIGILAAVVIGVINPQVQQDKARNSTIKSALVKAGYAIQAYFSANGANPSGTAFLNQLTNAVPYLATCAAANTCLYSITGISPPLLCAAGSSNGSGLNQCYFSYDGTAVPFTITVRVYNTDNVPAVGATLPAYRFNGNGQLVNTNGTATNPWIMY